MAPSLLLTLPSWALVLACGEERSPFWTLAPPVITSLSSE
jgi:hypothetical protein